MYCPKCGQEQIYDNLRFCSRCGFSLKGVAELISNDSTSQIDTGKSPKKTSLFRQITPLIGAKIVFLSIILFPFAFLISIPFDSPIPLLFPLLTFLLGFAQICYVLIFGKKTSPENHEYETNYLNPITDRLNLSPAQNTDIPIVEIRKRDTAKIIPPPSVTEPTTNLLELNDE